MPFFSVIIPVYNVEPYLERCLESILNDKCKDLELILVDDGSADGSGMICDRYAAAHTNIKVIHKPNGGLSSARNAGLEIAEGEWISFVDSDDWVDQDSYQKMKDMLIRQENKSTDIVKFGYKKIFKDRIVEFVPCVKAGMYDLEEIRKTLLPVALGSKRISDSTINTFVLSSCAHLYNTQFLSEAGIRFIPEQEVGSEDFLFLYSLYMRASQILVTDNKWYNYETREGSLTRRYRKKLFSQYKNLGSAMKRQLVERGLYSSFKDEFEGMYIELMYICIMNECVTLRNKAKQVGMVKKILDDQELRYCLRHYITSDKKSFLISMMMRLKLAFPLCMIQWRNNVNKYEDISE